MMNNWKEWHEKLYTYTTTDVVQLLKRSGIERRTDQISKYIRENNFESRNLAIKVEQKNPYLNDSCIIWKLSQYGINEILKHFQEEEKRTKDLLKHNYTIKQIVKKYHTEYKNCNNSAISVFIREKKLEQKLMAMRTKLSTGGTKWLVSQEGVDEMFKHLFIKKKKKEEKQETIFENLVEATPMVEPSWSVLVLAKQYGVTKQAIFNYLGEMKQKGIQGYNVERNQYIINQKGFDYIKQRREQAKLRAEQRTSIGLEVESGINNYLEMVAYCTNKTKTEILKEIIYEGIANRLKIPKNSNEATICNAVQKVKQEVSQIFGM